ncbi:MAG: winged-helix domain-containing protein, partial [Armatimonadota bacterium]
ELMQFEPIEYDVIPQASSQLQKADVIVLHESTTQPITDLLGQIRNHTDSPVIVIAGKYDERELVTALETGANGYVYPEWTAREILSRIRARIRRTEEYAQRRDRAEFYEAGPLTVDVQKHEVTLRGRRLDLTPKEFELLRMLVAHAGKTVPREELLREIWDLKEDTATRTLDVHVGRLRQKMEQEADVPQLIITVPGVGYKLREPE